MKYEEDFIMSVLEYAKTEGPIKAAKHFQLQYSTIRRWNDKRNVYDRQENRRFSEKEKIKILEYANIHGLSTTTSIFDVDAYTIYKWNETLKIYNPTGRKKNTTRKKQSGRANKEFKLEVLNFVKEKGMAEAMQKYDIPDSTIRSWNKVYNVYTPRKARNFSDSQKKLIIKYAEEHSVPQAASQYDVTSEQIRDWAQKLMQKKL